MFATCDESGVHRGSRWWVIGAIWLPDDSHLPAFDAKVARVRQLHGCWGEFKWDKLGDRYLDAYREFMSGALSTPGAKLTCFAVDTKLFTPEAMKQHHSEGGRLEAYFKYARLLLSRRIADFAKEGHREVSLLYDRPSGSKELQQRFRSQLMYDVARIGTPDGDPCRLKHFAPANSKVVPLLQATDLAVGSVWSAFEAPTDQGKQAAARSALRGDVASWAGQRLTVPTSSAAGCFNLWKWKP